MVGDREWQPSYRLAEQMDFLFGVASVKLLQRKNSERVPASWEVWFGVEGDAVAVARTG